MCAPVGSSTTIACCRVASPFNTSGRPTLDSLLSIGSTARKRSQIPAVTHIDRSGRLHTISRATNPRYYALIEAFRDQTGVPMVLNTSFNENKPVVCQPKEALGCFLRTDMDVLVLGDHLIRCQRD
jgi:predicted NodU family carbamoyl transferase